MLYVIRFRLSIRRQILCHGGACMERSQATARGFRPSMPVESAASPLDPACDWYPATKGTDGQASRMSLRSRFLRFFSRVWNLEARTCIHRAATMIG